jgi:hypothetical protein
MFCNSETYFKLLCHKLHRSINASPQKYIKIVVDLYSKKDYNTFLEQIKRLEMTSVRYHYILMYLGITELKLKDFKHTKAIINGFSIVDYNNLQSLKLIADITGNLQPLNRLPTIPVTSLTYFKSVSFKN